MSTFFDQVMLNKSIFNLCSYPVGNYMFKVNNRNTGGRCEIGYKLTMKKPERWQRRRSGVFIVNFEHILHLVLVFLYFCIYFEQVNAGWLEDWIHIQIFVCKSFKCNAVSCIYYSEWHRVY